MTLTRNIGAACAALLVMGLGDLRPAGSAPPPAAKGPIATVAGRTIVEEDIKMAAAVLSNDPLRAKQPALWRKKLLDLCIDRELLAMEAERQALAGDRRVRAEIERRGGDLLYTEVRKRALMPAAEPTASQIDTARAGGIYRRVKLSYILAVADSKTTANVFSAIQGGARFDSLATLFSIHPSAAKGGDAGWKLVGELNPAAWPAFRGAKPGDLLGPFVNDKAHDIYRVEAVDDRDDSALREELLRARVAEMESRYHVDLLTRYKFALVPEQVSPMIFAAATEKADSILLSLAPNGTRPPRGVHPALGTLAKVDGDSVTYFDIETRLKREDDGKARIEDTRRLLMLSAYAILPRLIARDAREHGIDRDPIVARKLRLIRDEVATRAMVARAAPVSKDSAALRAYFESHRDRYRRPAARRALVAMFASEDMANQSLRAWNGVGVHDSSLAAMGFRRQERASALSLLARCYAEIPLFETETDPLSLAARALGEGQMSPVIRMPHGHALAIVLGREPARPWAFEEVRERVAIDRLEDAENTWVNDQLERLRAAVPAQRIAARLDAVRLGDSSKTGGKRR